MYTPEMLESIKKVEATRAERLGMEPRRMTADEKDALLHEFHPDYIESEFDTLKIGPNKGEKVPVELAAMLQSHTASRRATLTLQSRTTMLTFSSSAAAEQAPRRR